MSGAASRLCKCSCARIDAALGPEEYRNSLIREGLRRELERREKLAKPPKRERKS